jgi:hypothetical protein
VIKILSKRRSRISFVPGVSAKIQSTGSSQMCMGFMIMCISYVRVPIQSVNMSQMSGRFIESIRVGLSSASIAICELPCNNRELPQKNLGGLEEVNVPLGF